MRHVTEEFNVYSFQELDERSKQRARDWFRSCMDTDDWSAREWLASFNRFLDEFNGTLRDYNIGERGRDYVKTEYSLDDCILELRGVRLWKWLNVRLARTVGTGDKRRKIGGHDFILEMRDGACHYTGCYTDCAAFDPLAQFVSRPDDRTLGELLQECEESFLCAVANDVEYRFSEECVDESIVANEYEFTEDGELYR